MSVATQRFAWIGTGALLGLIGMACQQPQPAQCICNCDGPPPEGAIIEIAEKEAKVVPAAQPVPAAPAAPAPQATARPSEVPDSLKRIPRKARGRVAAEPGSGVPKQMSDEDKNEMKEVFVQFAKAAKSRSLEEMKKATTERLENSLESSLEKYSERLYRRTDMFSVGAESGVTIGGTNDLGDGNFDIEIKFGTGQPVHVLYFKEEGKWRLNRL